MSYQLKFDLTVAACAVAAIIVSLLIGLEPVLGRILLAVGVAFLIMATLEDLETNFSLTPNRFADRFRKAEMSAAAIVGGEQSMRGQEDVVECKLSRPAPGKATTAVERS